MITRLSMLAALLCLSGGCKEELDNTAAPPGDLSAFRPFAHLARLAAFAGPAAKLVSIGARGVLPNGRMKLVRGPTKTSVSYRFSAKDDEGRYRTVRVSVQPAHKTQVSTGTRGHTNKRHLGMERSPSPYNAFGAAPETVPFPKCTAANLLAKTLGKKAKPELRASIDYNKRGYQVVIKTGPKAWINTRFDTSCKLIRRN